MVPIGNESISPLEHKQ